MEGGDFEGGSPGGEQPMETFNDPGTLIVSDDQEKMSVLLTACDIRDETTFCDVTFLVQGHLYRAHRIIVSAWSRWLRALLTEAPTEEVVTLDFFTAESFGAILDYMYGKPLHFSIDAAETLLKVIRRLELANLETHCWDYMMKVIDQTNCLILHEFADRYDCPPLKLTAWRLIQESTPAYAAMPQIVIEGITGSISNGTTGPAENFTKATTGGFVDEDEEIPSIFAPGDHFDEDGNDITHPDELPLDANATEVLKAWAHRLQDVYNQCVPQEQRVAESKVDWGGELREIYLVLNLPDKIPLINQILEMYKGKEAQMMQTILMKYKNELPTEYTYRISEMIQAK